MKPSVGGDIFLIPANGGKPQNLTPERKTSASWLTWTARRKNRRRRIRARRIVGDFSRSCFRKNRVALFRCGSRHARHLGPVGISISDDGKISAAIRSSFSAPPEIWAGANGDWKQITRAQQRRFPRMGPSQKHHLEIRFL